MIKHYLKVAFRNMRKYRTQSLIGIFGLAFGLACFVPALYWYRYETTYDSFYPDAEQIYRVYSVEKESGKVNEGVPPFLRTKIQDRFPAIEQSAIFLGGAEKCSAEGTPYINLNMMYADSAFLHVFPQEFVSGDSRQPLQLLDNIVITETIAVSLFGNVEKAIGQQIQSTMVPNLPPYTVTAVVKDPKPNSNLSFDAIIFHDMLNMYLGMPEEVQLNIFETELYVKFHARTEIDELATQLRDVPIQLYANAGFELQMMPISDIRHHLTENVPFTLNIIRLFVAAGLLLILSAVFNFLNLHLNIFHQRIHELRQRSVHGAKSLQLIIQMMFEMACTICTALAIAYCFVILTGSVFSELQGIALDMLQFTYLFVVCGTGVMMIILLIGIIPFWRLSRLAMLDLSKRKTQGQPILRRLAVSLQLAVSVVFIVAALVVMMQMRFVNHKDLGFDRNSIIQLDAMSFYMRSNVRTALINELEAIPQIENFTATYFEPQYKANPLLTRTEVEWSGKSDNEKPVFHFIPTDNRFAETFKLKMLIGKWWDEGINNKIVLNEEAVRVMGLSEPVGTNLRIAINGPMEEYEVVGVVNDFHTMSLRSKIYPTIFCNNTFEIFYISTTPGQEQEAIQRITAILPDIDIPVEGVTITPIGELYDRFNRSEQVGLQLFSVLATVCLLISLFGIYAVAVATTQRRRKEIAIRKVFGAEVRDIVRIFFREYTLQVIIAGAIALPLAYYAMHQWLQGYAYRTNIPLWLLVGVIIVLAAVVLLTVLGQIWKAANQNPAEVVKN
jgi:ABC-type transport system, involved in lipoprotein release, permease component